MPRFIVALFCGALLGAFSTSPGPDPALRASLQQDLNRYLAARAKPEHISALSLSVSLHGEPQTIDLTAGTTRYGGGGRPIAPQTLWQIGSNTKAFTSVLLLQLEAEGKLTMGQTVGRWLPQYPAWKGVTIRRLLNMTSGIPGYDFSNAMLRDYASNPNRHFTTAVLVRYAYPTTPGAPRATTGYSYSNTNYILAEMIVEKVTGHSYTDELNRRILRAGLGLDDTYYEAYAYPPSVTDRMTAGYFFSHDADNAGLAPLLGRDMRNLSVSWMQGAGGIVSTPRDVTRWARALYTGSILATPQRAELMSLVSQKTGEPIPATSLSDPGGFGLGVAQLTKPGIGTVWFYEGMTLGYRMVHVYFPRQDAVIAFGINSQPDSKQNQSGELVRAIYQTLHAAGKL
ncbi:MAG: beta-lactamase family protein [Candidatus Eremiobacteraeota bacterium]|nr:beta-lactamase family protein [Candidatus Eremiobacteraeota bacterium]MBV8498314.1 beta-lactamase family protein [Candidatus Eremiobacteraeota bacterium]